MQTATYPEKIEMPLAQESHSLEHFVSLSKGNSAGTGYAALGRGVEDMTSASTPSPGLASVMP